MLIRDFVSQCLILCGERAKSIRNFSDKRHITGCCPWMPAIRDSVGRAGNRLTLAVQKAPDPDPEDQKQSEPPLLAYCPGASYLPAAGPDRCSQPGTRGLRPGLRCRQFLAMNRFTVGIMAVPEVFSSSSYGRRTDSGLQHVTTAAHTSSTQPSSLPPLSASSGYESWPPQGRGPGPDAPPDLCWLASCPLRCWISSLFHGLATFFSAASTLLQ